MKKILLINLFFFSCAHQNLVLKNKKPDYLNLKFSEIEKTFISIKKDSTETINTKDYLVYLVKEQDSNLQLLVDPKTQLVIESTRLDFKNPVIFKPSSLYPSSHQPKCATKSTSMNYNLEKKLIMIVKNGSVVLEGTSNIILDRLQEDQTQKCVNTWGH